MVSHLRGVLALALCSAPLLAQASEAELIQRLDKLAAELAQVKAELAASKQHADTANQTTATTTTTATSSAAPAASGNLGPQTTLSGYGEITYNRPRKDSSKSQADVRRAVIGIEHRFDPKTKLVTEFEWEHAVTSAGDKGEAAVEQIYVEREFDNGLRAKGGLFLIPAGLLNTSHEPTAFYGVERNFVETAIIPSTWREAGIGLSSTLDNGLSWDLGLTTGFDLTKWDATSADGRNSPLASIHQEGQLAKSRDLAMHAALNWRGVPGLLLGGSIFSGRASHATANFAAPDARVTLWDAHARYTPGKWDLAAVYARGTISNTDALNATFAGNPTPIPSSFSGWYTQAAYQAWKSQDYVLTPFVRYEQFNTARSYAGQADGTAVAPGPTQKVTTVGANLRVGEGVVLKADYQKFQDDAARDRLDLGLGYAF
ncbi:MAG: OprO/OprP family phosphate-selective porin [Pseudomonadota bacterium]|nr:OprO/OprP family phosphate-selective porin [Pseudomonadota bacterium]